MASSYAEDRRLTKDGGEVRIQMVRIPNIIRLPECLYFLARLVLAAAFSRAASRRIFGCHLRATATDASPLMCGSRPRFGSLVPNRKQRGSDRAVSRI